VSAADTRLPAAAVSPETSPTEPLRARQRARNTLARAVQHLLSQQSPAGWWKGELETNVTIEAEDLMLRQFLGIRTEELTAATARWIRAQQRPDGTWATYAGGPGDLSTTIEAYVGLRLAGDAPEAEHMRMARSFVLANGGVQASRVFTRIWLALFGIVPWERLPAMPVELILLPRRVPLNIYDWACWARQTIVPVTLLASRRPVRDLGVSIDELFAPTDPVPRPAPLRSIRGAFGRLDRVLRRYERSPLRPLRRAAQRRAAEWIVARQEADGSWGGIQPPWVYSLLALHVFGYPLDHPVLATGLAGLERFTVHEQTPGGPVRRLEACQSPVWDSALALVALGEAGHDPSDPRLHRAVDWLLAEEIGTRGDWTVRRPQGRAGGWAFEFDNDGYPDTDDTAEVLLALRAAGPGRRDVDAAVGRGVNWLLDMQSSDGGWGAFDIDNTRTAISELPFCDFGAVIDPPSADVTAHIVEALATEGLAGSGPVRRAVAWLRAHQEPDGSWFGRWGANHVYGTGAVLPALRAAGAPASDPAIVAAADWLEAHQNPDGGWGEDLRSYRDPAWVGRGISTASQTAWALLGLLAADRLEDTAVHRGVNWLADTQRPDGGWDEPVFTGTGFPGDFYINYHLYRLVFPMTALGRFLGARE